MNVRLLIVKNVRNFNLQTKQMDPKNILEVRLLKLFMVSGRKHLREIHHQEKSFIKSVISLRQVQCKGMWLTEDNALLVAEAFINSLKKLKV